MTATIEIREGKPPKSGEYMAFWIDDDGGVYFVSQSHYNADTGRWNDFDGTGKYALTGDYLWADIPQIRKEK